MSAGEPDTLAECYREDPQAFRDVLADAERHGLDVLAEPMRAAIEAEGEL